MNITVAVITYNSSSTILETLASILSQSYGAINIELIISDDASQDNTVVVVDEWIKNNKNLFNRVVFIRNPINKGVSANINMAWRSSTCKWVKSIAGDDLLEPNCLEINYKYATKNPDCKIIFSKMQWFGSVEKVTPTPYDSRFFSKNSKQQNNWLKFFSFNIAPASFINTEALKAVGYANEKYKMLEDLPLWLKFTKAGYRLYFIDTITVRYRVSESITSSNDKFVNIDFLNNLIGINKDQTVSFFKDPVSEWVRYEQLLMYSFTKTVYHMFDNKKVKFLFLISYPLWFFRPVHLFRHVFTKSYNKMKKSAVK